MMPMPISAPMPIRPQLICPWITPLASAEISVACGAGSACGPGAEAVRLVQQIEDRRNDDRSRRSRRRSSATCWRQGVASTSWPVLRSCRLSLEIVATLSSTAVTKSANATSAGAPAAPRDLRDEQRAAISAPMTVKIAKSRHGAVGRADQPGHVAACGGDEEAREHDVDACRRSPAARSAMRARSPCRNTASRNASGMKHARLMSADHADRDVALGARQRVLRRRPRTRCARAAAIAEMMPL